MPDDIRSPVVNREPARPGQPVIDPAVWTGDELAARSDWIHVLSDDEVSALADAVARVKTRIGDNIQGLLSVDPTEVDLGSAARVMDSTWHQLRDGCGVQLIRGMPVNKWPRIDLAIAYWLMGTRLGKPLSNNPEGDMIGHVTDLGKDYDHPNHRGYQTSAHMLFHTDQCDIVSLLCLQTAMTGGQSRIVSAPAVHNEMVRRRADLAAELAGSFYWTRHEEIGPGQKPWYRLSVFNYSDGYLTTIGGYKHIQKGHALPGVPPLTEAQKEAFDLLSEINEELCHAMTFDVGDIQILNSYVTMHSRTSYEDWPEAHRRRCLWRLWLSNLAVRPRPAAAKQRTSGIATGSTRPGIRL